MERPGPRQFVASGQTVHSVFNPDGQRIAEYDETTGALIRAYVWLGDRPLAVIEGGQVYFVRTDHIGRPSFATTAAGTVVWTASYLPFGGVHVTTGAPIDLRFPGQWFQMESGLYQNWMRDYDPTTGRYIEADPLGLVDGASVYGYARQNPGRWTDPRGECVGPAIALLPACIYAGYLIYDYLTDEDGCYTLGDFIWFNIDYFLPGPRMKPPRNPHVPGPPTPHPPKPPGPKANDGYGPPHGGDTHNRAIDDRIATDRSDPTISNQRKNQQQVDVEGNKVGNNRPDYQYDKVNPDGTRCHVCVEFDHSPTRSQAHGNTIGNNDKNTIIELNLLP